MLTLTDKTKSFLSILFALYLFASCASIAHYDQYSYLQTTSFKVDALNIMDMAVSDFSENKKEISDLKTRLQKLYEYEKNKPNNEITTQMWEKLLDKNGHLLGGFFFRWEQEQRLGSGFINASKKDVAKAFDQISGMESGKIKESEILK